MQTAVSLFPPRPSFDITFSHPAEIEFDVKKKRTDYGRSINEPNSRTMANEVFEAARNSVNWKPYDNDGNGYVDAFIVVHAGQAADTEQVRDNIWSVKWVLPEEKKQSGVSIYGFLTVSEFAKIGVCAHEIGHLVFGWPDLYDTDDSSAGIGSWCLMSSGSWGGNGDRPVHPSACEFAHPLPLSALILLDHTRLVMLTTNLQGAKSPKAGSPPSPKPPTVGSPSGTSNPASKPTGSGPTAMPPPGNISSSRIANKATATTAHCPAQGS